MGERLTPDMGPNRLVFGGFARQTYHSMEINSEPQELEIDPFITTEEEIVLEEELDGIQDAERG